MTPDQAFQIVSSAALLGWLSLLLGVVVPSTEAKRHLLLVGGRVLPLLLSAGYVYLLATYWKSAPGGNFNSLDGVAKLFAAPGKLVGGWTHFLAFDLFIGRWMIDEVLNSERSRWRLLPALPLTFLYGPLGLLVHFAINSNPGRTGGRLDDSWHCTGE